MGDSEKLTALKKAYAEIILNTAKEAAARIMVSEKKAQRYQCELFAAKDEALRMLLRLKQMFDSKAKETEIAHLNQQKKIEELEAQLGEAEDIVKDLRTELRELQYEMERVSNNQIQPFDGHGSEADVATQVFACKGSRLSTPASLISSLPAAQCDSLVTFETNCSTLNDASYNDTKCRIGEGLYQDNIFVCNHDFPSIVMSSKEPEQYRNGCTQRIRAFERNMLDGDLSFSGPYDEVKNRTLVRDDEGGKTSHKKPTSMDNVCSAEKNLNGIQVLRENGNHIPVHHVSSFCKKRKRATGHKKLKTPSNHIIDYNASSGEDFMTTKIQEWKDQETSVTSKSVSDMSKEIMKSGNVEVDKTPLEFASTYSVMNRINNDKSLMNDLHLTRLAAGSAEGSEVSASKTDIALTHASFVNSDRKDSNSREPLSTLPTDKFLKYTFQRKRKKGLPSSPDGKSSLDNINMETIKAEKEDGSLESQNSSL